jgi:hypothetical protein
LDLHGGNMAVEKDLGKEISANADIHRKQSNLSYYLKRLHFIFGDLLLDRHQI